ncbi:uncharacterized protein LOC117386693 [Periophthalmus magnuspinnatus]|uniref:uncharacterized protein LOC117386693 n=1 Tax=Periophthalmus magnuspinnatus TaxID=409849 RepID=UPI00145A7E36|nr:uncharacterized protein LOC117386693 [Periophthalmus magnuspinnatus]
MTNVLLLLLLCSTVIGGVSGDEPLQQVFAFIGQPVILPCLQTLPKDSEVPTIEWSKRHLRPPYVFVYRQNFEVYAEKHRDFEFRTHLFMTLLQHGNFSMRLSNVRREDAGVYLCKTIWDRDNQDVKRVELVVVDLPHPVLSMTWSEDGQVDVRCVVSTCSPLVPHVTLYDKHGNALEMEKTERSEENNSRCYTVERRTVAKAGAESVVCRASLAEVSESKEVHMLIPEVAKESCMFPVIYAVAGTGVAVLVLMGLLFLIHKLCSKSREKTGIPRQSSGESEPSNLSESRSLLTKDEQDSVAVVIPELSEIPEQTQSTLTKAPGLISTANSISSTRDGKSINMQALFAPNANNLCDEADSKPATCEVNDASKTIKFKKTEQGKKTKLTRQNAQTDASISANGTLPNVTQNQANGISKPPAQKYPFIRSKSASASISAAPSLDAVKQCRRYSMPYSGASSLDALCRNYSSAGLSKFEKLSESESEQEASTPKPGNRGKH